MDALTRFDEHVKNLTPNQITPQAENAMNIAAQALSMTKQSMMGHAVQECWASTPKGVEPFTTANTDHACLDAKGYKRSK